MARDKGKRRRRRKRPAKPDADTQQSIDYLLERGWIEPDPSRPGRFRTTPAGTRKYDSLQAGGAPALRPANGVGLLHVPYPAPDDMDLHDAEGELRALANAMGVDLVGMLIEAGVFPAAPLVDRQAPQDAIESVRSGRASVVLVLNRGGLAPSEAEIVGFTERVERAGGSVVFAD